MSDQPRDEPRQPCLPSLGERCGRCHRCTEPEPFTEAEGLHLNPSLDMP